MVMGPLLRSFKDAFNGLFYCFVTQRNMAIHAVVGLVVVTLSCFLGVTVTELLFLLTAVFAVLAAEAFNTALEKAVDVATSDPHELAHTAKDVAAGAVLLAAFYAVVVGMVILGPKVWWLLFGL